VFFIKYAHPIAERRVTAWQFFVLRFSRLYPLHFATLLLVAALQWSLIRQIGHAVIYEANDLPHFFVNLLLIQNWSFSSLTSDSSFNAPSWSLSIEAFLYIVFFMLFVICRYVKPSVFYFLAIAVIGICFKEENAESGIARGLWCFFMGGYVAWCMRFGKGNFIRPTLYVCTAGLAVLLLFHIPIWKLYGTQAAATYILQTGVFAGCVGCMISWEDRLHRVARPFSFLGDISYSSYLLHFPMQLLFILAVAVWNGTYVSEPFRSPWMFLIFMAALIGSSLFCYHFFEVPARKALRSWLLVPKGRGLNPYGGVP